jgi:hypothetical protein
VRAGVGVWLAVAFGCAAVVGAIIAVAEHRVGLLLLLIATVGSALCWWQTVPLTLLAMAVVLAAEAWLRDGGSHAEHGG